MELNYTVTCPKFQVSQYANPSSSSHSQCEAKQAGFLIFIWIVRLLSKLKRYSPFKSWLLLDRITACLPGSYCLQACTRKKVICVLLVPKFSRAGQGSMPDAVSILGQGRSHKIYTFLVQWDNPRAV